MSLVNGECLRQTITKGRVFMEIIICVLLGVFLIFQSYIVFQNRKRSMKNRERLDLLEERVTHLETQRLTTKEQ